MAHGDVDMPDVHVDSRAVDDEPGPTTAEAHSESIALLLKGTKQKARPKGVNLKVRWRAKGREILVTGKTLGAVSCRIPVF